jgi:hypothetical protein
MNRFRALIAALALLVALVAMTPPVAAAQAQARPTVAAAPPATAWWSPVLGFLSRLWSSPESPPATGATAGEDGQDTTPSFDPDGLVAPPHPDRV